MEGGHSVKYGHLLTRGHAKEVCDAGNISMDVPVNSIEGRH